MTFNPSGFGNMPDKDSASFIPPEVLIEIASLSPEIKRRIANVIPPPQSSHLPCLNVFKNGSWHFTINLDKLEEEQKMKDYTDLRRQALEIATMHFGNKYETPEEMFKAADKVYKYLTGEAPVPESPSKSEQ